MRKVTSMYDPIDVVDDGTTLAVEMDHGQASLIVEAIRIAIPEFATEGMHEVVGELTEIVKGLSIASVEK